MSEACTVILQDRSYCVDGRFAGVIRQAVQSGASSVDIETPCACGTTGNNEKMRLKLADIVNVIHHGAQPLEEPLRGDIGQRGNVIMMRPR